MWGALFLLFSTFDLITCSSEGFRCDMGQVPDPSLWVSIFTSEMRRKIIHVFQHFFVVPKILAYQLRATVGPMFWKILFTWANGMYYHLWILASLANRCHTSWVKFPLKAKTFYKLRQPYRKYVHIPRLLPLEPLGVGGHPVRLV